MARRLSRMAARVAEKGGDIVKQGAIATVAGTIERCNYRAGDDQKGPSLWMLVAFPSSNPKAQYPDRLSLSAFGKKASEYGPIVGEGMLIEASCSVRPRTIKQEDGGRRYECEFIIESLRTEDDQRDPRNERPPPKAAPQRPRPSPAANGPRLAGDFSTDFDHDGDIPF